MSRDLQLDNSTFHQKRALRQKALTWLSSIPVIMETHGGRGVLFESCYANVKEGIVFEKEAEKADILGEQRPTWRVYECDTLEALNAGVGGDMPINFLDLDPYGEPHPILEAYFNPSANRVFPQELIIVVNDGFRQRLQMQTGWSVHSMRDIVGKYGNDLYRVYLEVCRELLEEKAGKVGYTLTRFHGYYCGKFQNMTHYAGVLTKEPSGSAPGSGMVPAALEGV